MEASLLAALSLPGRRRDDGRRRPSASTAASSNTEEGGGRGRVAPHGQDGGGYTRLCHSRQLEPWDCGVASLVMVARWLRTTGDDARSGRAGERGDDGGGRAYSDPGSRPLSPPEMDERRQMLEDMGTTSIWTTDLVLQLDNWKERGRTGGTSLPSSSSSPSMASLPPFRYAFVSKNLSVNDDHREVGYYQRAFDDDERRVTRTFQELASRGAPMISSSPSSQPPQPPTTIGEGLSGDGRQGGAGGDGLSLALVAEILEHNEDCVAIALLDNHVLCIGDGASFHAEDAVVDDEATDGNGNGTCDGGWGGSRTPPVPACSDGATTATTPTVPVGSSYFGHYVILCGISREGGHLDQAEAWDRAIRCRDCENHQQKQQQQVAAGGGGGNDAGRADDGLDLDTGRRRRRPKADDFCFVISNPAPETPAPFMFVTPRRLEASWRAKGTDEDIIFIRKCVIDR